VWNSCGEKRFAGSFSPLPALNAPSIGRRIRRSMIRDVKRDDAVVARAAAAFELNRELHRALRSLHRGLSDSRKA
jgi:hypothetical protein